MELRREIELLEDALRRLGVPLREEALPEEAVLDGALCKWRGSLAVFIARDAPPEQRATVLRRALAQLPTEDLWLPPAIRRSIGRP